MNKNEFVNKVIGTPWVNRGYSFDGCDCFGLVYLYMKHVNGILPSLTDEYLKGKDFAVAFKSQLMTGEWVKQDSPDENTIVFMMYAGELPTHCGVMLNKTDCLHAFGSDGRGQTVVWKMNHVKRNLKRYYKINEEPRVEFYKWVN